MTNKVVTNRVANIANIPPIEGGNVREECSLNTREQCSPMFACSPKMFALVEMILRLRISVSEIEGGQTNEARRMPVRNEISVAPTNPHQPTGPLRGSAGALVSGQ
jgi:hypothetical protein